MISFSFRKVTVLAVVLILAGCGFVLSAVPRFSVIKHAVTAEEMSGYWVLRTNELRQLAVDGFVPKPGEEVFITLRTNGTYDCRMISRSWSGTSAVDITQEEGKWSVNYEPDEYYKNLIYFKRSSDGATWYIAAASDDGRTILWKSWGDPDEGVDLVFEREERIK